MSAAIWQQVDEQLRPLAGWLGTYALHSTIALGLAWLSARWWLRRSLAMQEALLRQALWLPIVSASLQFVYVGNPWSEWFTAVPLTVEQMTMELATPPKIVSASTPAVTPDGAATAVPWALLAVVVAGALAIAGMVWMWRTWRRLHRLLATRRPETDPRVLGAAAEMATGLGLRHSPQISRAEGLATPIAFGFVRPEICLPARVASLDGAALRAMLGHELAHLRRGDPGWMWFGAWVHALFPWQMMLWIVRRQWARTVELSCDAEAAHHTSPTAVARCLVEVAGWLRPQPVAALGMAARPSALRERVEAALGATRPPRAGRTAIGAAAVFSLAALTMAAPGFGERPQLALTREDFAGAWFDTANGADRLQPFVAMVDQDYAEVVREASELKRALAAVPAARSAPLLARLQRRLTSLEQLRARLMARMRRLSVRPSRSSETRRTQ